MDLSPIIYFEIGVAILLALGILCAKPEYGLFLYGLALGFPDAAIPLGTTINVRVDDILIVFFLFRSIAWRPAPLSGGQRKILLWQVLFLIVCILSAVVGFTSGNPPGDYETVKMLGCAVIVFTLPRILQSERRLRFLIAGLMCAGVALIVQIIFRIGTSAVDTSANFQALKSTASFTTWNPNTIGQAATHDPEKIAGDRLHHDLHDQFKTSSIQIPPLRERREDIPLLARYFMQKFARSMKKDIEIIAPETIDALLNYDWPGNVAQLENFIQRSVILTDSCSLQVPLDEL